MKLGPVVALLTLLPAIPLQAAGFATSDNFTVFSPRWPNQEIAQEFAEQLLKDAERYRKDISRQWLGEELPPGVGKTTINVKFSDQRHAALTWAKDDPRRKYHVVYLTTTPEDAAGSILAHEMVHVVLATRYAYPDRIAPWIEEGIAGRYDDASRHKTRRGILSWFAKTKNAPPLSLTMNAQVIAATDQESYAVAFSLVELLLSRRDRATLLAFGQDANSIGWNVALKKHYAIQDVADLTDIWEKWLQSQYNAGQANSSDTNVAVTANTKPSAD